MNRIKIAAVSYLNTKPFIDGLSSSALSDQIDLTLEIPSKCAERLISGEVDLSLIPVAELLKIKSANIISDYCIGANGPVHSVAIYAQRPIHELKRIFLDYQSRTSVALTKVLLKKHWQLTPELIQATPGYENQIGGDTGGLIIGDRAFEANQRFDYIYDLGDHWKQLTDMPFVFAAWVANKPLPFSFVQAFNIALKTGLENIKETIDHYQPKYKSISVKEYFSNHISFHLDAQKKQALQQFLKYYESIDDQVKIPELSFR